MKKVISTLLCMFISFVFVLSAYSMDSIDKGYKLNLSIDGISKIEVTAIGPMDLINYSTESKNIIKYFITNLNSLNLIDDGKIIYANDVTEYSVKLHCIDGIKEYGFSSRRFVSANKQYGMTEVEYIRLVEFVEALNEGKFIFNDEVLFETSEWAKTAVEQAIKKGIVPELNQINYKGNISRLEVCQLVCNLLSKTNPIYYDSKANPFLDTDDMAVVILQQFGIIDGKSENQFVPYDYITREEFAKILSNAYKIMQQDLGSIDNQLTYIDKDEISDWARESVAEMSGIGVFKGNEFGEFNPQNNITKEEVIVTLLRILE